MDATERAISAQTRAEAARRRADPRLHALDVAVEKATEELRIAMAGPQAELAAWQQAAREAEDARRAGEDVPIPPQPALDGGAVRLGVLQDRLQRALLARDGTFSGMAP